MNLQYRNQARWSDPEDALEFLAGALESASFPGRAFRGPPARRWATPAMSALAAAAALLLIALVVRPAGKTLNTGNPAPEAAPIVVVLGGPVEPSDLMPTVTPVAVISGGRHGAMTVLLVPTPPRLSVLQAENEVSSTAPEG